MTLDTLKASIDFVVSQSKISGGRPVVCFFGGEPMLHYDDLIVPSVEYAHDKYDREVGFTMTTNGTLLNEKNMEYIAENRIALLFSADGGKLTQSRNRPNADGSSSFQSMKNGAIAATARYPFCRVRATLTKDSCGRLFDDMNFLSRIGFKSISVFPDAGCGWTDDEKSIIEQEVRKYSNYVIDCYRNGDTPYTFYNMIEVASQVVNQKMSPKQYSFDPCSRCGTGCSLSAAVGYDGKLYTCHRFSTLSDNDKFMIGDVFDGINAQKREAIYLNLKDNEIHMEDCDSCVLSKTCDGICLAENYQCEGDLTSVSQISCWWRRITAMEFLYISNTLGDERNESFKNAFLGILNGRSRFV